MFVTVLNIRIQVHFQTSNTGFHQNWSVMETTVNSLPHSEGSYLGDCFWERSSVILRKIDVRNHPLSLSSLETFTRFAEIHNRHLCFHSTLGEDIINISRGLTTDNQYKALFQSNGKTESGSARGFLV